ncbi:hypothetical protein [Paracoccus sp. NSM]|uniref:hypothetical protein n=1 Tax=Paracoccus sp. NSM TaxID=3457784 RepID=UPI0040374396
MLPDWLGLIMDMLSTPGTPEGPYERMAAAFGHSMIGVLLAAAVLRLLSARPWLAAAAGAAIYAPWEAAQMIWFGSSLADSAIDLGAALCGALIAASLWAHRLPPILPVALVLLALGRAAPRDKDRRDG